MYTGSQDFAPAKTIPEIPKQTKSDPVQSSKADKVKQQQIEKREALKREAEERSLRIEAEVRAKDQARKEKQRELAELKATVAAREERRKKLEEEHANAAVQARKAQEELLQQHIQYKRLRRRADKLEEQRAAQVKMSEAKAKKDAELEENRARINSLRARADKIKDPKPVTPAEPVITLDSLRQEIRKLEAEKSELKMKHAKAEKKAEKYQKFLQDKMVPLQKGKEAFDQARAKYQEMEEDMTESLKMTEAQLRHETEKRVKELVDTHQKMQAIDLVLGDLATEQKKRNDIMHCRSVIQLFENKVLKGDAFSTELSQLASIFSDDKFVSLVISKIDDRTAAKGFATTQELSDSFSSLARSTRQSLLTSRSQSGISRAVSKMFSYLLVHEAALREETDTFGLLSSTTYWIEEGKFLNALNSLKKFQAIANTQLGEELVQNLLRWQQEVESKLAAEECLRVLKSYLLLQAQPNIL